MHRTPKLRNCPEYVDWLGRGSYFFLELDKTRALTNSTESLVGTHAASHGSSTSLWDRLKQHYGTGSGRSNHPHGGSHRGSVYRKRVGEAMIEKYGLHDDYSDWDKRWSSIDRERSVVRDEEYPLERRVSTYIREQPFLWVNVDDEPSADSDRAYLEQNAIALLSNFRQQSIDPRDDDWLGRYSRSRKIRDSGLWNVNHVEEHYDSAFLNLLARTIENTTAP